jgi:hypothetical protein
MKQVVLMLAALIFTGMATAQNLPPGVLLLSRVKVHISEELQRQATTIWLEDLPRDFRAAWKTRPLKP